LYVFFAAAYISQKVVNIHYLFYPN